MVDSSRVNDADSQLGQGRGARDVGSQLGDATVGAEDSASGADEPGHAAGASLHWSRHALLALVSFVILHWALAGVRRLTFDEAHYLAAARAGIPWPIDYHPPLLGVLLSFTDRLGALGLELRTRSLPALLQLGSALFVAVTAARLVPKDKAQTAFDTACVLATWGLMTVAVGFLAVPETPLVFGISCLFWTATELAHLPDATSTKRKIAWVFGVFLSALFALMSKASALPCILAVAFGLFVAASADTQHRRWDQAGAFAALLGAAFAAPFAVQSVLQQSAHIAGLHVNANQVRLGSLKSLLVIAVGIFVVFSPLVLSAGWRSRAIRQVPGGRLAVMLITGLIAASAVVSGRLPEVHWFAPASVPLFIGAAAALAELPSRTRGLIVVSHVLPGVLGLALWAAPLPWLDKNTSFFASCPHVSLARNTPGLPWVTQVKSVRSLPEYGEIAWRKIYGP